MKKQKVFNSKRGVDGVGTTPIDEATTLVARFIHGGHAVSTHDRRRCGSGGPSRGRGGLPCQSCPTTKGPSVKWHWTPWVCGKKKIQKQIK